MDLSHLPWGYTQDDEGPLVVNGRYKLPGPDGRERSWTRVTTLSSTLQETYSLDHWDKRVIAHGIGLRPDLAERAAVTPVDDKRPWKEITAAAHEAGGGSRRANHGTALHAVVSGLLTGAVRWEDVPPILQADASAYFRELERFDLRQVPTLTERTVVNLDLDAAGTFDICLADKYGALIVGDLKSGDKIDLSHVEHAAQMATYNHAHLMREADGSMVAAPPFVRDFAILIHVPYGSGQAHIHRVDTNFGYAAARVAFQLRGIRSMGSLMVSPYLGDDPALPKHPQPEPALAGALAVADLDVSASPVLQGQRDAGLAYIANKYGPRSEPTWQPGATDVALEPVMTTEQHAVLSEALADSESNEPSEQQLSTWADNGGAPHQDEIDQIALTPEQVETVKDIETTLVEKGIPEEAAPEVIQQAVVAAPPAGLDEQAQELFDLLPSAQRKAKLQALAKEVDPSIKQAQHAIKLARAVVGSAGWVDIREATLEELRQAAASRKRGRPKKEATPVELAAGPEPDLPTEEEVSAALDERNARLEQIRVYNAEKAKAALDRVNQPTKLIDGTPVVPASPFLAAPTESNSDSLEHLLRNATDAATMMGLYIAAGSPTNDSRVLHVFYRRWLEFAANRADIDAAVKHAKEAGHAWRIEDKQFGTDRYQQLP